MISFIFKIKKPLDTFIGFVKSSIFKFLISSLICLLREFSLIQSNLPPKLEVAETLYLRAAKSKPLLFITSLISLYFLSRSFRFEISKEISDNK